MKKKDSDSLEAIVAEAIEREKKINEEHPERKGYGMVQGEADDLIARIRKLERKEDLAQRVKGNRITQRIRIINSDRLYCKSPEDVALDNIYRAKINRAEKKVLDSLSQRSREIYDMKETGASFTDISKIVDRHVSNVSRSYHSSVDKLREEFKRVLTKEITDNGI